MNNQTFSKIWIVVIAVVLVVGGIFAWQYLAPKEKAEMPEGVIPEKVVSEEVVPEEKEEEVMRRPFILEHDNLLRKMFPGWEVKDGKIKIFELEVALVKVEIFIERTAPLDKERILSIAFMTGIPHFYGGYRVFLAVFDSKGNILTSPFSIPKPTDIDGLVYSLDNFRREDGAFAEKGDGQFSFYNCKEIKYILFTGKFCVVGQCMEEASLHKIEEGKFRTVQKFIQQPGTESIMVTPGEDKIRIYRSKQVPSAEDFICPPVKCLDWVGSPIETGIIEGPEPIYLFEKDLFWNNITCRFE